MRIIFMGTPEFAVPSLQALIDKGHDVCLVITQPDKPKGRGNKVSVSPVKEFALKEGIDIIQPENVKTNEFTEKLRSYNAELIITAAYGKILTKDTLESAKHGCINVHASLLPQYRGAAPLWWVIINGENKTGITTMYTDEGMDTGDILEKSEYEINSEITVGELSADMALLGAELLVKTLDKLEKGTLIRTKQEDSESSYAPMIKKDTGHIKWDMVAREIHNLVRGANPWPAAYTFYKGMRMKIYKTEILSETENGKPGEILCVSDEGIKAAAGKGCILIKEVQLDSSKRMSVKDYIRGHKVETGILLGE